ncbi:MAG TPA: hypothetical protein VG184_02260 [Acidimicrobiales bacterium]|jgi:hypothetical protein|nr:hypothetical protein [Acidimicrobiales bacterium]
MIPGRLRRLVAMVKVATAGYRSAKLTMLATSDPATGRSQPTLGDDKQAPDAVGDMMLAE